MDFTDFELVRLTSDYQIKEFDCKDDDLNNFLFDDAKSHIGQLFSVTYLLEKDGKTIAFFSLVNDKIKIEDTDSKTYWKKKVGKNVPYNKKRKDYPAVKIGRLAVDEVYKGHKIGTIILDYIKIWFLDKNKTGCRFVTVDAYEKSLGFYEKNEFDYLTNNDKGKETRVMYYDLLRLT